MRIGALALALGVSLVPSRAEAVVFQDGAVASFDLAGAKVCLAIPESARSPEACEGLDTDKIAARVTASALPAPLSLVAFGIVRFEGDDRVATLSIVRAPPVPPLTRPTFEREVESFVGSLRRRLPRATVRTEQLRLVDAPSARAGRVTVLCDGVDDEPSTRFDAHHAMALVGADDASYLVDVQTERAGPVARVDAWVDGIVRVARVTKPPVDPRTTLFGWLGRATVWVIVGVAVLAVVFLARRRKEAPAVVMAERKKKRKRRRGVPLR